MKRIYLDIGNTRIKIATRKNLDEWSVNSFVIKKEGVNFLSKLPKFSASDHFILSSVRSDILELLKTKISAPNYTILDKKWIPNQYLDYQTPDTLGMDRFISCLGAAAIAKNDIIVIDAGSAITVDYMTSGCIFKGGTIIPGKKLLLDAIKQHLPELPLPDTLIPGQFPGKSTIDCMRWGFNGGYKTTLDQFIIQFQEINDRNADIYLTGGDSEYVISLLSEKWNVIHHEYLIFEGMEKFLELFIPKA